MIWDFETILDAIDATWPAERRIDQDPWRVRLTQGAGRRVSSTSTLLRAPDAGLIDQAEAVQRAHGQTPLFSVAPDDEAFDADLRARGYRLVDPVRIYAAPVTTFPEAVPMRAFAHWPPLAAQLELWAEAGIGPARLAVMDRVQAPKMSIMGRSREGSDRVAGSAFVAAAGGVAMLHALEVRADLRRQGVAVHMMAEAAHWAAAQGCSHLALIVLRGNAPAEALYQALGMQVVADYHYRTL